MCSVAGFIAKKPVTGFTAKTLAKSFLFYGEDRGAQSAGAFLYSPESRRLLKKAMTPSEFIYEKSFENLFEGIKPTVGLFHTRMPTMGGRGDKQAQPFRRHNTVTIHNGVYSDWKELKEKFGLVKKSGVDSELVTDFIEDYGIDLFYRFLQATSGCSSIAAFHHEKLYLARSMNPMWYSRMVLVPDNPIFLFASTTAILENAIRYGFLFHHITTTMVPSDQVWEVDPEGKFTAVGQKFERSYTSYDYRSEKNGHWNYKTQAFEYDLEEKTTRFPHLIPASTKSDRDWQGNSMSTNCLHRQAEEEEDTVYTSKKNKKKFRKFMRTVTENSHGAWQDVQRSVRGGEQTLTVEVDKESDEKSKEQPTEATAQKSTGDRPATEPGDSSPESKIVA